MFSPSGLLARLQSLSTAAANSVRASSVCDICTTSRRTDVQLSLPTPECHEGVTHRRTQWSLRGWNQQHVIMVTSK